MKALREKHLACVADNLSYFNDCKTSFAISECKSWINKIFDDVEAELEALQPRSCEWCKSLVETGKSFKHCDELAINISHMDWGSFCCNRYEAKDNQ